MEYSSNLTASNAIEMFSKIVLLIFVIVICSYNAISCKDTKTKILDEIFDDIYDITRCVQPILIVSSILASHEWLCDAYAYFAE